MLVKTEDVSGVNAFQPEPAAPLVQPFLEATPERLPHFLVWELLLHLFFLLVLGVCGVCLLVLHV